MPLTDRVMNYINKFTGTYSGDANYLRVLICAVIVLTIREDRSLNRFSLREIASLGNVRPTQVSNVLSRVKRDLRIHRALPQPSFIERFIQFIHPDTPVQLKAKVKERMTKLLGLCTTWFEGNQREILSSAVIQMVCNVYNVAINSKELNEEIGTSERTIRERMAAIRNKLVEMTVALPVDVNEDNAWAHLFYIIDEIEIITYVHQAALNVSRLLGWRKVCRATNYNLPPAPSSIPPLLTRNPLRSLAEENMGVLREGGGEERKDTENEEKEETFVAEHVNTAEQQEMVATEMAAQERDLHLQKESRTASSKRKSKRKAPKLRVPKRMRMR
ncbi:hypothetical protein AAMO2058_000676900 [Amorphochlora amoebiformis]